MKKRNLIIVILLFVLSFSDLISTIAPSPPPFQYAPMFNYSKFGNNSNQYNLSFIRGYFSLSSYNFLGLGFNEPELSVGIRNNNNNKTKICWKACLLDVGEYQIFIKKFFLPSVGWTLLSYDKTSYFDTEAKWLQLRGCYFIKYLYIKKGADVLFSIVQPFGLKAGFTNLKLGNENYSELSTINNKNLFGFDASFYSSVNIRWKYLRISPEINIRGLYSNKIINFDNYSIKIMYSIPELDIFKFEDTWLKRFNYLNFIFGFDYQKTYFDNKTIHNKVFNLGLQYYFGSPWEPNNQNNTIMNLFFDKTIN